MRKADFVTWLQLTSAIFCIWGPIWFDNCTPTVTITQFSCCNILQRISRFDDVSITKCT